MTMQLEDELAAAMREQTAGLRPSADLLDRAARRNRRRTVGTGIATGAFGLAAVLAVTMTALGGTPAVPPVGPGTPAAPELLTVAQVTERAVAALAADDVLHVRSRITTAPEGDVLTDEQWYDEAGRRARVTRVGADGAASNEVWIAIEGDTVTTTLVDHARRTWSRSARQVTQDGTGVVRFPADPSGGRGFGAAGAGNTTEQLRAALTEGGYALVGPETRNGFEVLRLRAARDGGPDVTGTDDLWVDAETYRAVRRETVWHTSVGDNRIELDFEWLPRGAESSAPFTVRVPAGYTERENGTGPN